MKQVPEYHVTNWQVGMACRVNGWNPACKFRIRSFQKNGKALLDGIVHKKEKPLAVWLGELIELDIICIRNHNDEVLYKVSESYTRTQMEELYSQYTTKFNKKPEQLKLI